MAVNLKTSRKFNEFLKWTLGTFVVSRYDVRAENLSLLSSMTPPYLVLPNHVSFWDPFILAKFIPAPVSYVTSDIQFRNPIVRFLLGLVGAIPKAKAVSDFEAVRNIFRVKQMKGIIGIFPEGRRNWDGHTMPLLYATAKLVKSLKIPVIVPIFKGAYLALPRWSRKRRKGPVIVEFRPGPDVDEIKALSVDEIYEKLTELLEYDEWDFQRTRMYRYRSNRRAEGLELTLFACPQCESIGTLRSHRVKLFCSECGYGVRYSEYGFFEPDGGTVRFETIRDWNLWQLDHIGALLNPKGRADSEVLMEDSPAWAWTGFRRNPMKKFRLGALRLHADRVVFDTMMGEVLEFPLSEISGVNVQINERMEFYHQDHLYSFHFRRPWVSGFKWMAAIHAVKGEAVLTRDFVD